MNSITINNNIAEAIDILLNKRLSQLSYDQTITAEIYEVIDKEKGYYKIEYQSAILDAYSENADKTYGVKQTVYVKVPKSDFSQKLIIESRVGTETLTESQRQNLKNYKNPIKPNFKYNAEFKLIAGSTFPQSEEHSFYQGVDETFQILSKNYEIICLEATFKNHLINLHTSGNYGLRFDFLTTSGQIESYVLDTHNFVGNFYKKDSKGSKQKTFYFVEKGKLQGIDKIIFFQEGMEQDKDINNPIRDINTGKTIDYPRIETENLFASNPAITFYEVLDLLTEENYLVLDAPMGYIGERLTFSAQLLNEGKDILTEEYSIFWYKKEWDDTKKSGINWKQQNTESSSSIEILNEVEGRNYFKVSIFNKEKELVAEKQFEASKTKLEPLPEIGQSRNGDAITLFLPTGYKGDWYKNDARIGKEKTNSITLKLSDFRLEVEKVEVKEIYQNDFFIAESLEIEVSAPVPLKNAKVTAEGKTYFKYDAFNNLRSEDAGIEKFLTLGIVAEKEIENIKLYFSNSDIELSKDKEKTINPANSQLKNVYYEELESGVLKVHFFLNNKLETAKTNNTLVLQMGYKDEPVEDMFYFPFYFASLGDIGTNGTSNACFIVPESDSVYLDNNGYRLTLKLFEDGKSIKSNNDYEILELKVMPKGVDYSKKITVFQDILISKNDVAGSVNYLSVRVRIGNEVLQNFYPIPVGKRFNYPLFVKYNFNGKNGDKTFSETKAGNNKWYYFDNNSVLHYLNLYSNQAINDWQIEHVKADEENGTLLSEQIFVGDKGMTKEGAPKLSGIMLGDIKDDTKKPKGIYGYKDNKEVFSISVDGEMTLGKANITEKQIKMPEESSIRLGDDITLGEQSKLNEIEVTKQTIDFNCLFNGPLKEGEKPDSKSLQGIINNLQSQINELSNRIDELHKPVSPN